MSEINPELKLWLEAVLLAADRPLPLPEIQAIWPSSPSPEAKAVQEALAALSEDYEHRAMQVMSLANGYQIMIRPALGTEIQKLWSEKPSKYTRSMLETLALIAYRQPITRGEIEEVRGVSVSSSTIRTLLDDLAWIRIVGHRAVPGKPALFATTRTFLDYFGLKALDALPDLPDLVELGQSKLENLETTIQEKLNELSHTQE